MSFAARMLTSLGALLARTFTQNLTNTNTSPGSRAVSVVMNSNGTGTATVSGSAVGANWYPSTVVGVGAQVWAKVTTYTVSGAGATPTLSGTVNTSTWVNLSGGGTMTITAPSLESLGTYKISFSSDSAGGTLIGSISGNYDVGYTP